MLAHYLSIHPHHRMIISSPHIQKHTLAGLWMILKITLIPYGTFIIKQPGILRIPVARNLQGRRSGEIILNQLIGTPGLAIQKKP